MMQISNYINSSDILMPDERFTLPSWPFYFSEHVVLWLDETGVCPSVSWANFPVLPDV